MTMRTAMAGKGLVMKYRVVSKEAEIVTGKNTSLVLLNQLLRITCESRSYSTSQQVYQQAGLILAQTECFFIFFFVFLFFFLYYTNKTNNKYS